MASHLWREVGRYFGVVKEPEHEIRARETVLRSTPLRTLVLPAIAQAVVSGSAFTLGIEVLDDESLTLAHLAPRGLVFGVLIGILTLHPWVRARRGATRH